MSQPAPFDLTGRVALVTGGNGGIGRAIALGFARAGASVAIAGRNPAKTAAVLAELAAIGRPATALALDVTDRAALAAASATVEAALGPIDILVNNAGIAEASGGILRQSEDGWDTMRATHVDATFLLSKSIAAGMAKRGRGKIINLASMYAYFGSGMAPGYSAAKGAIVQLTKSMAIELARHNIQVNALAPGWIETDMTDGARDADAFNAMLMARTPAGRWGKADELAGAAVFLASAASDFVTGVTLPVDGGYSIF
ncbi:SDR family NAD(P)-dependent oxidoreductase [Sphingomonas immobilis]|uniref:SDR family oxidoreductase n=1 Tax=Sphingomonas immobilis TaxID=3063997 RepID=A0ABT8ZXN3_9SPHN|nr:SDR family oxidoreductase [Sphingomonas sp. CA1-15]MDO7842308.1 SDR family oxidoreductase [Sphingomonas sp. CA1-15]